MLKEETVDSLSKSLAEDNMGPTVAKWRTPPHRSSLIVMKASRAITPKPSGTNPEAQDDRRAVERVHPSPATSKRCRDSLTICDASRDSAGKGLISDKLSEDVSGLCFERAA